MSTMLAHIDEVTSSLQADVCPWNSVMSLELGILKPIAYREELCPSTRVDEVTRSREEGESKGLGSVCLGTNTFERPGEMGVSKRHSRRDGSWAGKKWCPKAKKKRLSRREWLPGRILVFCFCLLNIIQILKIINSMLWGEFYSFFFFNFFKVIN